MSTSDTRCSLAFAALLVAACGGGDDAARDTTAASADSGAARAATRAGTIEGFDTPESVKYDAEQDVYYVSNINGNPSRKDGNGWIARVAAGDSGHAITRLVEGGKKGATLNAPKGMALVGDTLWVADIDALRGFDRRTGAPVASIQFPRPVWFLNDVAQGPDGALYVTDTGVQFDANGGMTAPSKGQIFRVEGREVSVASNDTSLAAPNGIAWDAGRSAFVVGSFAGPSVLLWSPTAGGAARAVASGPGQYDGVEVVNGRVVLTSWADSSLQVLDRGGSSLSRLAGPVPSPADIGVDTRRSLLLVPLFTENRVEMWTIPGGAGSAPR